METIEFNEVIKQNIEVVGGLLGIYVNMKEDSIGISDLNNFKKDFGISMFRNVENKPEGISAISVMSVRINNSGWFSQIGITSSKVYYRTFDLDRNVWKGWVALG
ncbi:hypothetical protein [Bacteroides mediterraneensis]|uniref:hypothetical protein n=1 Tax=Bacteroides mediterraneensis TaxID=1841856 RepID=UPI0009332BB4|nr:hypothetical protein [Bacteroides mediterraneensis]